MSSEKFSLDDILNEYDSKNDAKKRKPSGTVKADIDELLNDNGKKDEVLEGILNPAKAPLNKSYDEKPAPYSSMKNSEEVQPIKAKSEPVKESYKPPVNYTADDTFDRMDKSTFDDEKPRLIKTERSSLSDNDLIIDPTVPRPVARIDKEALRPKNVKPVDIDLSQGPKIRPMSDSTRAKQLNLAEQRKKNRKKQPPKPSYEKDSVAAAYGIEQEQARPPRKVQNAQQVSQVSQSDTKKEHRPKATVATEVNINVPKNVAAPEMTDKKRLFAEAVRRELLAAQNEDISKTNISKPEPDNNVYAENAVKNDSKGFTNFDIKIADEDKKTKKPKKNAEHNPHKPKKAKKVSEEDNYDNNQQIINDIFELKGTLILRTIVLTLVSLFSIYITTANTFKMPIFTAFKATAAPQSFTVTMLILGGIAIISSLSVFATGFKNLFKFKADTDSLTVVSVLACMVSGVMILLDGNLLELKAVHMYMPVAILSLLFNAIGKIFMVSRALRNLEYITAAENKYAFVFVNDESKAETMTRGTLGDYPILSAMRKTSRTVDFLKYTFSTDLSDKFCRAFTPTVLIASLAAGALNLIKLRAQHGGVIDSAVVCVAVSVFAMCISACAGLGLTLVSNMPLFSAAKKYSRNTGVILGYQSIDDYYDTNSILIEANKLFPKGMINLSAIKILSDTKIDDAIIAAASITKYSGSILQDTFSNVIVGRKEDMLYPVDNFTYEDGMGICGWIDNKRVLLGTRELMKSHNIEGLPTVTKEIEYTENGKDALYLSISGNLAALFIIEVNASREVKEWMSKLESHNICLIIKSIDPLLSITRIAHLFRVSEDMIKIIPQKLHTAFDEECSDTMKQGSSIICSGKFANFAQLLLSTRSIRQTTLFGVTMQAAGAILGFAICATFIVMNAYHQINPAMLIIFNLVWTAMTAFVIKIRRV